MKLWDAPRASTGGIIANSAYSQAAIRKQRRTHKRQYATDQNGMRRYTREQKESTYVAAPIFRPRG